MKTISGMLLPIVLISFGAQGADYSYQNISKRHIGSALSQKAVKAAEMQGECLVGLKELNFKRKNKFDPVSEWTNYRSVSLLEQYSPCEVLIIMEVAQSKLQLLSESE